MSGKPAVVVVCPTCGNYPMVCTLDRKALKDNISVLIYYIAQGGNVVHIDLTPEQRAKLLACKCDWGVI